MTPSDMSKHKQRYQRKKREHNDLMETRNQNDSKNIQLLKEIPVLTRNLEMLERWLRNHTCNCQYGVSQECVNLQCVHQPSGMEQCLDAQCVHQPSEMEQYLDEQCVHQQSVGLSHIATIQPHVSSSIDATTDSFSWSNPTGVHETSGTASDHDFHIHSQVPRGTVTGNLGILDSDNAHNGFQSSQMPSVDALSIYSPHLQAEMGITFQSDSTPPQIPPTQNTMEDAIPISLLDDSSFAADAHIEGVVTCHHFPTKASSTVRGASMHQSVPVMDPINFAADFHDFLGASISLAGDGFDYDESFISTLLSNPRQLR